MVVDSRDIKIFHYGIWEIHHRQGNCRSIRQASLHLSSLERMKKRTEESCLINSLMSFDGWREDSNHGLIPDLQNLFSKGSPVLRQLSMPHNVGCSEVNSTKLKKKFQTSPGARYIPGLAQFLTFLDQSLGRKIRRLLYPVTQKTSQLQVNCMSAVRLVNSNIKETLQS